MAADDSPARTMRDAITKLRRRWDKRFQMLADELAAWFATATSKRSDLALKTALRRGGFTVKFRMTREMNDVLQATIAENVSLIKSIPEHYLTQVEGAVMRSVSAGRDLASLTKELTEQHGVTRRRAELISRDQNNKSTAVVTRVRQRELGITKARWLHSGGGREPRPTHIRASRARVEYDIAEGWLDPAINRRIWPGTEINCRCVAIPILPIAASG